ncbi:MAG: hypothetical protein OJI67_03360, partial [Prosthecobacter sp.]|nr:hypothetical protein [Prosthecobacter sp.]
MSKAPAFHVLSADPTLLDFQAVERGITERLGHEVARSRAFSHYVLETVFHIPSNDADSHIVDGGNDRGIDIVYIDAERRQINLGSCKVVTGYKKARHNFPGTEIDKIISFVNDLLFRREDILSEVNPL